MKLLDLCVALWLISPGWAAQAQEEGQLANPLPSMQDERDGGGPIHINLQASISRAIHEATAVQKARGDFEINGEQLLQSYAEFLPSIAATGSLNKTTGKSYLTTAVPTFVDGNSRGPSYQLTATLNLFNGLADLANWRASIARKDAADLTLKRAKQEIALDVAQSYLQVILDQQIVKIAHKNLAASQVREKLLTEQTRVGVRNLADLFRQQAQTSSDESFLVNSQSKERSDELSLLRKLRLDTDHNYVLDDPSLPESSSGSEFSDEDHLIKTALEYRADLTASEDAARAASWDVKTSRSTYLPKLDFVASVGSAARWFDKQLVATSNVNPAFVNYVPVSQDGLNDQLSHQVQYTVGLNLTWTIFDRWMTSVNVEKAKVAAHNSRLDNEDRRLQVIAEIRQAFGDYKAVLQQLESTKKGLQAAQKAFDVVEGRYQVGASSFVDLITSQSTLVQAEASRAQAVIALELETRALQTSLGTYSVE